MSVFFRLATDSELEMVHSRSYIDEVKGYSSETNQNACKLPEQWPTYVSSGAYESAACAVGCLLNMVDLVMTGEVSLSLSLSSFSQCLC